MAEGTSSHNGDNIDEPSDPVETTNSKTNTQEDDEASMNPSSTDDGITETTNTTTKTAHKKGFTMSTGTPEQLSLIHI